MSEDNRLINEIVFDFIIKLKKRDKHSSIHDFLERTSRLNIQVEDLIFAFASLVELRYNWYSSRNESDGSGKVRSISFERDSLIITSWEDEWFEYSYQNGYRWRTRRMDIAK